MQRRIICYGLAIFAMVVLLAMIYAVIPRVIEERPPRTKLEIFDLVTALGHYQSVYGIFPVGESASTVRILAGDNPQKIVFLNFRRTSEHPNEMVDPWGKPYQIEFFQETNFVIRSAGKDKLFGDKDDVIFNSVSNDFVKP